MDLNPAQKQAVEHFEGPAMVLAGPGSGKTTVITARTKALIEDHGVRPEEILVITFTRAAAREMQSRFEVMTGNACPGVSFGTFHAVFFAILRAAYGYRGENILREDTRFAFFREEISRLRLETEDEKELARQLMAEVGLVKGEGIDPEHYYSKNCPEESFRQLYRDYDAFLRRENRLDFEDMLVMCRELFLERPDILARWQKRFRYLLVDEFQDINRMQYEIVRMLAKPENHLFIVGDDDQSIYRFRGSKPELMLRFPKDYPGAVTVPLTVNYRSTPQIVAAAARLIVHNKERYPKDLRAVRPAGQDVIFHEFPDLSAQTDCILDDIEAYRREGVALEEMAVLFRSSTDPRMLVTRLMSRNTPFTMKDYVPNLYDHWICQDIFAYLRIVINAV